MARKVIFRNYQSPGDLVMLLYGICSLHESHPGVFETGVQVSVPDIFKDNPLIVDLDPKDPEVKVINADYPDVHRSNTYPVRFSTAFANAMEEQLGVRIRPSEFSGLLYITPEENSWFSGVHEQLQRDVPYWILNAGHKHDFTAKAWDFARYQELVTRLPDVWFAQVGAEEHEHPKLEGDNVINFVGKTDVRQMIRLVYNSFGVISGVSFPMHLAYAVPAHPRFKGRPRANITIAGGREPAHWEQGPNHQFLHTCGMLSCCANGGCWKSRVVPINDGDGKDRDLCEKPVLLESGQWIAQCMSMITVDDVFNQVRRYMDNLEYAPKS